MSPHAYMHEYMLKCHVLKRIAHLRFAGRLWMPAVQRKKRLPGEPHLRRCTHAKAAWQSRGHGCWAEL